MKKPKKDEINQVLERLGLRSDVLSAVQCNVIRNRMTETDVFRKYVTEVATEQRSEEVFYAARDAAQYIAGKLPATALIPDFAYQEDEVEVDDEIKISRKVFENLIKRIERLERRVGIRTSKAKAILISKDDDSAPDDLMTSTETIKFIGCGKSTLMRWKEAGYITAYYKNAYLYFSKSEIVKSDIYKDYKENKQWKKF